MQELRLLSKLESAGLLSGLEKSGLTLSKIEKAGLLTVAESSGLLSAAGNRYGAWFGGDLNLKSGRVGRHRDCCSQWRSFCLLLDLLLFT